MLNKVREAFIEEIEKARKGKTVLWIGYHLPDIKMKGELRGVGYFNYTTFQFAR